MQNASWATGAARGRNLQRHFRCRFYTMTVCCSEPACHRPDPSDKASQDEVVRAADNVGGWTTLQQVSTQYFLSSRVSMDESDLF